MLHRFKHACAAKDEFHRKQVRIIAVNQSASFRQTGEHGLRGGGVPVAVAARDERNARGNCGEKFCKRSIVFSMMAYLCLLYTSDAADE